MPVSRNHPLEAQPGWFGSILGWACLFLAAASYGTVHLTPRLWTMVKLQQEYDTNQLRLVSLERQLSDLDQMAKALETDAEFAAALARVEFPHDQPGVQRIPVEPHLAQDPRDFNPKLDVPEPAWPWFTPLLKHVVENPKFNNSLLASAALFTLMAFIPLRFQAARVIGGRTVTYTTGLIGFLRQRYTSGEQDETSRRND